MHRYRAAFFATIVLVALPQVSGRAQTDKPAGAAPGDAVQAEQAPSAVPPPRARSKQVRDNKGTAPLSASQAGDTIKAIRIEGNARIEEGTILSYMLVQPGDSFAGDRVDRSLRTLYATGLFSDVALQRDGATLVVKVVENPLVNGISFEGNHNVKEEDLRKALGLRPRAVFTTRMAQTDRGKLLGVYAGHGRFAATVEPQLIRLPQNRVNVVFKIVEGPETKISRIIFVGNHAFKETDLRAVIDTREERIWRFFSSSDSFNPERVNFDRELLRRFYLEHGYADFVVTGTVAELSPDKKAFFLTFQLSEGDRYKVGKVDLVSTLPKVPAAPYRGLVRVEAGAYYNGNLVEKTSDTIQDQLRADGFPFVAVTPRIARDHAHHKVDLLFSIGAGQRSYVERIDITGNSRTQDKVIRREFRFAEGDPNDPTLIRKTKTRLTDLGYFTDAKLTPTPGSTPDRVVVNTEITEKATGELSLGGGYSTTDGILGQAGLRERNLIGTGIDAGINGTLAARQSQIDISATDPYFLDRNLVAGVDVFYLNNNNRYVSDYSETRYGTTLRLGYAYNDHVTQAFTYSVIDRDVNNISPYASIFVRDQAGYSLLSQLGQTLQFDWRDSRVDPHSGFILRFGTDFAGLGGDENYVRGKLDGTYFIPLDRFTGNADWGISVAAGAGYLYTLQSKERIIDRFFLGGDNLRGFLDQGVGPHSVAYTECAIGAQYLTNGKCNTPGFFRGSDSLGGRFIYTQSTELHFPLPVSADFGLAGRAFVDLGGLSGLNVPPDAREACLATSKHNAAGQAVDSHGQTITQCFYDDSSPRIAVGFGVSWKSPFGLINIDIGIPVVKKSYDQTQILKFGFGTRFQ